MDWVYFAAYAVAKRYDERRKHTTVIPAKVGIPPNDEIASLTRNDGLFKNKNLTGF
ncbi:MAG: hypothetical protein LBJ63_08975 [Prevotellaceae bacterium]|nr:hypothetical protein [Prevotellaceae bacterium]